MRILLIPSIYLPSIGGVQINTHQLAKHLVKLGHEVIVLTSMWRKWDLPFYEEIDQIKIYRLPFYVFRGSIKSLIAFLICSPLAFMGTLLCILKFKPHVVNLHFLGSNSLYILLTSIINRIPIVVTLHGNEVSSVSDPSLLGYTKTEARWMKRIILRLLKRVDYIISVSNFLLNKARSLGFDCDSNSETIYMVGGLEIRDGGTPLVSTYEPFILSVGRFSKQKGFDILVEAFRLLTYTDRKTTLIIIGDGPEMKSISEKVCNYSLQDRILLQGALSREQIEPYYRNCLFFVSPSRWEGLGVVIIEAFAHAKAVVASSVDGIPELVINNFNGILVPPDDINLLTFAMKRLLNNASFRNELEGNVKTFMKDINSWRSIAKKYSKIFEYVLNNRQNEG